MVIHHPESTSGDGDIQPPSRVIVGRARDNFEAALAAEGISVDQAGKLILEMTQGGDNDSSHQ